MVLLTEMHGNKKRLCFRMEQLQKCNLPSPIQVLEIANDKPASYKSFHLFWATQAQ